MLIHYLAYNKGTDNYEGIGVWNGRIISEV